MSLSHLNVLISGASIAGPFAAYWLSKAGARVTVIERFSEFRKGGQNVDIRSVGVTVMRRLPGLEEKIRSKLYKLDGFQFVDTNDATIATMLSTGNADQQSLVSEFEIFRGDLSGIFYDLTKDKVNYIFGQQVTAMRQQDSSVDVTFQDGKTDTFDLVIAADGSTSRTRALGFDCAVRDHVHPMNAWSAWFTTKEDITKTTMGKSYSAVPGLFLGVGPDPAGGNKVAVMSIHNSSDDVAPFRQAQKGDFKAFVTDRLRGAGWKCDQLADSLQTSDDLYGSEMVQVRLPKLSKGRFVTVGDAAHASGPTGTGTSMAMCGAYVLAGELARSKDVLQGLQAYEERMAPIIKDLTQIPPGVPGILAPQTEWRLYLRNLLFKAVAFGSRVGQYFHFVHVFGSAFSASDKYNIPVYEF